MKIGLISDTHSHLDESIFDHFESCDEIWHAGDIGNMDVLERLEAFKPTIAVWGNVDSHQVRIATGEHQILSRQGVLVMMTHIAGSPPKYNPTVRSLLREHRPKMLICGHSHILKVQPDRSNNLLYVNPGAAGIHGFHRMKTIMRFDLSRGKIENMEVIELGLRGKLPATS